MRYKGFTALLLFVMVACASEKKEVKNDLPPLVEPPVSGPSYRTPAEYNFRFVAMDVNVTNPADDCRSYYRIYIDKVDAGRTTIGLESQEKTFDSALSANRHLVKVEKYILDEKKGRYEKLNNIDQPKPDYFYFEIPKERIVILKLVQDKVSRRANFNLSYETE